MWGIAQLHAWRGGTSKATTGFLRTQLGFVLMNKISPSLVYLGVLCAETWVVTGNQETVLWNKNRLYLCGCQMFGVHTGLKWSTPCSRKSLLHRGLCQLWDEILLPYKSQASEVSSLTGVEFSAVTRVVFSALSCLCFPPGKHTEAPGIVYWWPVWCSITCSSQHLKGYQMISTIFS